MEVIIELVDNTLGASYNGNILAILYSEIKCMIIEEPYQDYPKCVKIFYNNQVFRTRIDNIPSRVLNKFGYYND